MRERDRVAQRPTTTCPLNACICFLPAFQVSAAELAELDTFASNLDRSMGVPPPPPNSSPNADYQSDESLGSGASKDDEEEDDDDGEPELLDVEDEALQTPRPKPLTFSTSNDSTITQVDAEYV